MRAAWSGIGSLPLPAWAVPGTAFAWLAYARHGALGYDPAWALVWGRQIAHGHTPDLDATSVAPTPHPLANLVAAVASLFGDHAPDLLLWLSALSFALLLVAAFALGRAVSGPAAGLLLALLIATRVLFAGEVGQAGIDIPFLALVLAAAAGVVRDPRGSTRVFVALGLAGLLRPEAWGLAVAYAVYLGLRAPLRRRATLAALALAAPVLWALSDLWATGDPFFSLHGTQDLATLLDRPRDSGSALHLMTPYLRFILGDRVVWLGFAGAIAGVVLLYRRVIVPSLLLWLGLAAFVALGLAHLPVLIRYLLMPGTMLALFAAVALVGWTATAEGSRVRRHWILAAAAGAIVLIAGAPHDADQLRGLDNVMNAQRRETQDLRALLRQPAAARWSARCRLLDVDGFRHGPMTAYLLGRDPRRVRLFTPRQAPAPLALIRVGDPAPSGYRRVTGNPGWTLYERCGAGPALSASSA